MTLQKIHYISIEQQLFEKNISTSGLSTLFLAEPHLRQHLDAIHRPARHFLDTGVHPRDVQQQERHRHEAHRPHNLPENPFQRHRHHRMEELFDNLSFV